MDCEDEFLRAQKQEQERKEVLENVLEEIRLFNLHQEDSVSEDDTANPVKEEQTELSHLYPSGITFFDKSKVCSLFTTDSLTPPLLPVNEGSLFLKDVLSGNIRSMVRGDPLEQHKDELVKYLFQLMFALSEEASLIMVRRTLLEIMDSVNKTFFSSLVEVFLECLPNLGGLTTKVYNACSDNDENSVEKKEPEDDHIVNSEVQQPINLEFNIRQIFKIMCHALVNEYKRKIENISKESLQLLLCAFIAIAHDPLFINTAFSTEAMYCIRTLLEFFPEEDSLIHRDCVMDIVEDIGRYWEDEGEMFAHHRAAFLCSDLLPDTPKGNQLRASLAYYSLKCCLDDMDVVLEFEVSVCKLVNFYNKHFKSISTLSYFTLHSFFMLTFYCVERPLQDVDEKESLKRLIETVGTIPNLKSSNEVAELSDRYRLEGLVKIITSEWQKLLVGGSTADGCRQGKLDSFLLKSKKQDGIEH